jgi:AmpE protein
MHLIALLIGLVIERFATRFFHWRRMRWLDRIIDAGFRQAERLGNWPALIPVIVLAVLLVLPVVGIMFSLGETLEGFTYLILAIIVLLFSIGPKDIGEEVDDYCKALQSEDEEQIQQAAKAIIEGDVPTDPRERIASVEEAVCVQANNRLFAVVFWFVVLGAVMSYIGPLAAWTYRVTDLIRRRAVFNASRDEEAGGSTDRIRDAAELVHGLLAWVPARLTALGYAAAGHADEAIAALRAPTEERDATLSEHSEHLLARVGVAALALQDRSDESITERGIRGATAANKLVFRLLLIFAVIIAAMTLYGSTR